MNEVDVVDIGRNAMWVIIKVAGPIMFLGLVSGLIIALFQALTTIQEMTLTFVPKIIVIFIG
ncbi:MAG TPA: flagellar biosynthetic protein FliQ, partial [Rhodospirillaceae bacterium]|nr:flagellar biosynthetic protein FliQ [Rhodospirillaceae bacterium]